MNYISIFLRNTCFSQISKTKDLEHNLFKDPRQLIKQVENRLSVYFNHICWIFATYNKISLKSHTRYTHTKQNFYESIKNKIEYTYVLIIETSIHTCIQFVCEMIYMTKYISLSLSDFRTRTFSHIKARNTILQFLSLP